MLQSFPEIWTALNVTIILLDIYPSSELPLIFDQLQMK